MFRSEIRVAAVALALALLGSSSPAQGQKKPTLEDDLRKLDGTWRTPDKVKPFLEIRVEVVERKGQASTASALYLPMVFQSPGIELKEAGDERLIQHKVPARDLGLTSVPYRFDGNTLILNIREGSLKGEHKLIRFHLPFPVDFRPRSHINTNSPRVIWIFAKGWQLEINKDGSGRLVYGSTFGDEWPFDSMTFDTGKVARELAALASDAKGSIGTHYHFQVKLGEGKPDVRGYTKDARLIPGLLHTAKEGGRIEESGRGTYIWENHAPYFRKE